jgi:hypothetical protein
VQVTYNSTQPQQKQPAHRSRPSIDSQNGTEAGGPPKPSEFLIANPRLRFALTNRKLSPLKISNREQMPIFSSAASCGPCFVLIASVSSSDVQPLNSNLQLLIVTPELKFPATRRKQTANPISNRYKSRLLHAALFSANAVVCCELHPAPPSVSHLTQPLTRTSIVRLPRRKILDRGAFRGTH